MEVFSEAWAHACCERLNASEAYRAAAAEWVGSIVLAMSADPAEGVPDDRAIFIDAHQGACRGARLASDDDLAQATFLLRADVATWRLLLGGELEPVAAVMQGKLRLLRGGLFTLARFAQAAREMVAAAALADGRFPAVPAVHSSS